jgi:hypothetical protein
LVCLTEAARLNGVCFAKCRADYHSGRWTAKRAFAFTENDAAVTGRDAAEFCSTFSPTVPVSMKKPDLLVRLTACEPHIGPKAFSFDSEFGGRPTTRLMTAEWATSGICANLRDELEKG